MAISIGTGDGGDDGDTRCLSGCIGPGGSSGSISFVLQCLDCGRTDVSDAIAWFWVVGAMEYFLRRWTCGGISVCCS